MRKYAIILQPGPNNWGAFSPDVPGCVSIGDTPEETLSSYLEALEFHLEALQRDGDPMPLEQDYTREYDTTGGVFYPWAPVNTAHREGSAPASHPLTA